MDVRRADTIVDELEQMIVTGQFHDGVRLDETRLAQRFGVSRTPLREAFQKLAVTGLVEQIPRRGSFVRHLGPVQLLERFEVMAELEAICGRLAASRISDTALGNLREANRTCSKAIERNDADDYYRENERFHHIIYQQSGNGFLEGEALRLGKRLKPFRRMQLHLRGRMDQSMQEHEEIVQSLAEGNAARADALLRSHVSVQGEKFQRLISHLKETHMVRTSAG